MSLFLSLSYFSWLFIWDLISSLLTFMVLWVFLMCLYFVFFSFTRGSIEVLKELTPHSPVACDGSCVWDVLGLVFWLGFGVFYV